MWDFEPYGGRTTKRRKEGDIEAFQNLPQTLKEDTLKFWKTDWKEPDLNTLETVNVAKLSATKILNVVPQTNTS